jgi:hypothetical protein
LFLGDHYCATVLAQTKFHSSNVFCFKWVVGFMNISLPLVIDTIVLDDLGNSGNFQLFEGYSIVPIYEDQDWFLINDELRHDMASPEGAAMFT